MCQKNEIDNKKFEFNASSKKDNLKFILMSKNNSNDTSEIGSKTYSLEEIVNQDPLLIKVEIPSEEKEEENKDNIACIIQAKLQLRWSDLKYYEQQKENEEQKIKKLITDLEEADETIKKIEFILSEENKSVEQQEEKDEKKVKSEGLRKKLIEFPEDEYIIEFNYERFDNIVAKGFKVDYNNEKELNDINEIQETNGEIEFNNQDINNNIYLDYNYNSNENENNLYDINYNIDNNNNIENYNENKEENLIQEDYDYSHDIIIDETLNNQQNEQINIDNQININPQQNYTSYNGALLTQSTNKEIIQESTLPLKYLPQKVNKVIYDNNVSTLPLIDAGKKVTYFSMP